MRTNRVALKSRPLETYIPFDPTEADTSPTVRVVLYPTQEAMRVANELDPDAKACFDPNSDGFSDSGIVGSLYFSRDDISVGTISHECLHATMEYERLLSDSSTLVIGPDEESFESIRVEGEEIRVGVGIEETLAHSLGQLVEGVVSWLFSYDVQGDRPKR